MVQYYTPLGSVGMTNAYFSALVGRAVSSCYGVADLAAADTMDDVRLKLLRNEPDKGVVVTSQNGRLSIQVHIKVIYGINISAIVKSITNKVKYTVETATGLTVRRIDVFVDDIVA